MIPLETVQSDWEKMPNHSRIWIYPCNRALNEDEKERVADALAPFIAGWNSHGKELSAAWALFFESFIVLFVDEGVEAPSGCSIDKSVRLFQQLDGEFKLSLFDRMTSALWTENGIERMPVRDLWAKMKAGTLSLRDTLVFDNLVKTKGDLERAWILPLSDSWHKDAFMR